MALSILDDPARVPDDPMRAARPYAEGRGIRVDVKDAATADAIETLVGIKIGLTKSRSAESKLRPTPKAPLPARR